ncbi:MAG: cytochrome c family protein [Sphingorhabdus sp.]
MAIASKLVLATATCFMLVACGSQPDSTTGEDITTEGASVTPKAVPGKILYLQCAACHSLEADGVKKSGPNLLGVVGRKSGSVDGFKYSKALSAANLTWTREELDKFITKPFEVVPGTIMAFSGIADPEKRKQLIDYIESAAAEPAD